MSSIAFFDFDGTITDKDTLLEFIKYSKGKGKFYLGFLLSSPWLIAYKIKLISNQRAKEKVLRFFFRDMPLPVFEQYCKAFVRDKLPAMIRPRAAAEITKLQTAGFRIVIVSASPGDWIQPWATTFQADLIATRLETRMPKTIPGRTAAPVSATAPDPRLTGKISGINCHGQEKVNRIKEKFTLEEFDAIYAYGDTKGDIPMLALGTRSFMKPFNNE
jgi:phosphatidylglycerophosphatase C